MVKRKKRLEKQVKSLLEQAEKHRKKAEEMEGEKDTTKEYWISEAKRFEEQAKQRKKMLKKLEDK